MSHDDEVHALGVDDLEHFFVGRPCGHPDGVIGDVLEVIGVVLGDFVLGRFHEFDSGDGLVKGTPCVPAYWQGVEQDQFGTALTG